MKVEKNQKSTKGITLIALVITIIVLLILAGVSIATLTGQNGILTRAQDSKTQTEIAEEKEAISLAYSGAVAEKRGTGKVTASDLNREFGTNGTNATAEDGADGEITVTFDPPSNRVYTIDADGNISDPTTGEVPPPTGSLPSTAETSPFLPDGATVTEDDLEKGVTIKDSNNNEWVWIVVPKSVIATSTTDEEIKNAVIGYATNYIRSYSDTWYDSNGQEYNGTNGADNGGCGLTYDEYQQKYSEMLQSVKANGGFYIGKYEVGSFDNPVTSNNDTRKSVIQEGAYPYNYVTCSQAEALAEGLATGGKTSTLMFGIQWDLVLAYLESKGVPEEELNDDSGSWGNYYDVSFDITRGKYSTDDGASYTEVIGTYSKPASSSVLLTTGVTERNSKMNIYDLAGNVWERTLEKSTFTDLPCVSRGGYDNRYGLDFPAYHSSSSSTSSSRDNIGFRPALY